jgi:hypothetical protein
MVKSPSIDTTLGMFGVKTLIIILHTGYFKQKKND